jgi:hypothetical protein
MQDTKTRKLIEIEFPMLDNINIHLTQSWISYILIKMEKEEIFDGFDYEFVRTGKLGTVSVFISEEFEEYLNDIIKHIEGNLKIRLFAHNQKK